MDIYHLTNIIKNPQKTTIKFTFSCEKRSGAYTLTYVQVYMQGIKYIAQTISKHYNNKDSIILINYINKRVYQSEFNESSCTKMS